LKKLLDKEFYDNLDDAIKEILPLKDFLFLERKNYFDCEYYKNLIEKIADITYLDSDNFFDKILNFIQVLDLEPEKIGRVIKDCDFIKEFEENMKRI
jgi:hypothetical protein